MADAARVLPVLGLGLILLPLLWGAGAAKATSTVAIFLFLSWLLLIICAAGLSRHLNADKAHKEGTPDDAGV